MSHYASPGGRGLVFFVCFQPIKVIAMNGLITLLELEKAHEAFMKHPGGVLNAWARNPALIGSTPCPGYDAVDLEKEQLLTAAALLARAWVDQGVEHGDLARHDIVLSRFMTLVYSYSYKGD